MTENPLVVPTNPPGRSDRWVEIAKVFTRLGFTAFGGPVAHVALMEQELVRRRQWCDRERFWDAVSAIHFIPGPNSTELAIHMGFIRGGYIGLILAGVCFITPAVLIILPLAFLYVRYGSLPQVQPVLHTISAVLVAIIAGVCFRLIRSCLHNRFTVGIAILALGLLLARRAGLPFFVGLFDHFQPEILILSVAAGIGIVVRLRSLTVGSVIAPAPLLLKVTSPIHSEAAWISMILFFLKVGATLFGSGYVLISFLQSGLIDRYGWINSQQLTDAIAVGQFTPGPLLTTASFLGYILGHSTFAGGDAGGCAGAVLATVAIFLPSFFLVALLAPRFDSLRQYAWVRNALDAMNAAVLILIADSVYTMSFTAFRTDGGWDLGNIVLAMTGFIVVTWTNINATWLILIAGGIGLCRLM